MENKITFKQKLFQFNNIKHLTLLNQLPLPLREIKILFENIKECGSIMDRQLKIPIKINNKQLEKLSYSNKGIE